MTPTENDTTSPRVDRGGCWNINEASWVLAASRYSNEPAYRYSGVGFRCSLAGRVKR